MVRKLFIQSPFYQSRGSNPVDMIVIHHIGSSSGKIFSVEGAIKWFTDVETHRNKDTGKVENPVSAHYIIPRKPYKDQYDTIQTVKDEDIAWHAGDSTWAFKGKSRRYINKYSIGIELEGDGNAFEYTDYQYGVLVELVSELVKKFNISENNVVGHEDIAPQRKVDPGRMFDWKKLRMGVYHVTPVTTLGTATPQVDPPPPMVSNPSVVTVAPIVHYTTDPIKMQGGKNSVGKSSSILDILIKIIIKLLGVK